MRVAIAQPCIGSSASAWRMRRSSVPWTRSTGFMTLIIYNTYVDNQVRGARCLVQSASCTVHPAPGTRHQSPGLAEQILDDEPDVRRTLGEAAHVPREPVLAVRDQHAQRLALPREL